jgi:UDP-N-acetylglucosamine--N-acetylmuramyl-(pentapeptide) pyrophosphoryl-undecaprenol N-acetylglucosamine transferase
MSKKIIIAGGGTGGHIFPAVAIAHALKRAMPTIQILFVGAIGKMEMEKVPQEGFEIKGLNIAGFNRTNMFKNFTLPFKILNSFLQVKKIFKTFKPDAVLGVGGYSTFPVLKMAQSKGIPTFIHESNAFAGKANKMLGKKATKIFVAANGMDKFFPAANIMLTGNPVRTQIYNSHITKTDALNFFNLEADKKTILAIGGSLGAKSINESILNNLELFKQNNIQLIWQTGKVNQEVYAAAAKAYSNVYTNSFITKMDMAYGAADVVISRAGAMAIAELCALAKASILVPYPHAAEDHQTHNAQQLVNAQAGILVNDADAAEQLCATALSLVNNQNKQQLFINNIKQFATNNADEIVANEILKYIA